MLVGEDFAQGAVVLVGHPAVGENIIKIVVLRVAPDAALGPFVFVGGMVENKVHHGGNARFVQRTDDFAQIVYCAQRGIDVAVAADRIAAVALAFGAFKQRHHVQVSQAQFPEIRDFFFQAFQVAGEQVDITYAADHFVRQQPVGIFLTRQIGCLQIRAALRITFPSVGNQLLQHGQHCFVVAVYIVQFVHQIGEMHVQTLAELLPILGFFNPCARCLGIT